MPRRLRYRERTGAAKDGSVRTESRAVAAAVSSATAAGAAVYSPFCPSFHGCYFTVGPDSFGRGEGYGGKSRPSPPFQVKHAIILIDHGDAFRTIRAPPSHGS